MLYRDQMSGGHDACVVRVSLRVKDIVKSVWQLDPESLQHIVEASERNIVSMPWGASFCRHSLAPG